MAQSRRIFIGIPILEKDCPKFFTWSRNLTQETSLQGWNIRWSRPENYHVTVCFLGDSDAHPIEGIIQTIEKEKFSPFWMQIQDLGFFNNGKNANVMWAGVESQELHEFQQKIQTMMINLDYKLDFKPFRPHITIGRVKNPTTPLHEEAISTVLDQFRVTEFGLYESILSIHNIQYYKLATFQLR